jgi:hypothetical protein
MVDVVDTTIDIYNGSRSKGSGRTTSTKETPY